MIGGSSGLNAMAWVRPRKDDLDNWSNFGVQGGWNWDGLLPYMIKSENVSIGSSAAFPGSTQPSGVDSSVNGRKGPIQVSYDPTFTGVQTPTVQSFLNIGAVLNQVPVSLYHFLLIKRFTRCGFRKVEITLVSLIHNIRWILPREIVHTLRQHTLFRIKDGRTSWY